LALAELLYKSCAMPGNWEPWPGNTYAFIGLMFGGQIYGKFFLTTEAQRQQREISLLSLRLCG